MALRAMKGRPVKMKGGTKPLRAMMGRRKVVEGAEPEMVKAGGMPEKKAAVPSSKPARRKQAQTVEQAYDDRYTKKGSKRTRGKQRKSYVG